MVVSTEELHQADPERCAEQYKEHLLFNASKKPLRKIIEYTGGALSDGVHAGGGGWRLALGSGDSLDDERRYLRVQVPAEMELRDALEILDLIRGSIVDQVEGGR